MGASIRDSERMIPNLTSEFLVTGPAVEPLLLADVKEHLQILDSTYDDDQITRWIETVRKDGEDYTRRAFITQTWDFRYWAFPPVILVPRPRLQSVTSIKYIDTEGNEQTLDSALYDVDIYSEPARIEPAYGETWPSTRDVMNAVTVRGICGYGDAGTDVPAPIRSGMLTYLTSLYAHRGDWERGQAPKDRPMAWTYGLAPYKSWH